MNGIQTAALRPPATPSSISGTLRQTVRSLLKGTLPKPVLAHLRNWRDRPRRVRWSRLRSLEPVGRAFGLDRGRPIDRYYIEAFLSAHEGDIQGAVLEVAEPTYTAQFGGDRVTHADVLHVLPGQPHATLVGDLATGNGIPVGRYDCIVLTQTLPFIYDAHAAVANCRAALRPGGVLLCTVPGLCPISRFDQQRWGDYWRFTPDSLSRMLNDSFGHAHVQVQSFGNALAATGCIQGMACEDLSPRELDVHDPDYPVVLVGRAVRKDRE